MSSSKGLYTFHTDTLGDTLFGVNPLMNYLHAWPDQGDNSLEAALYLEATT